MLDDTISRRKFVAGGAFALSGLVTLGFPVLGSVSQQEIQDQSFSSTVTPVELSVENRDTNIGVDVKEPAFSWKLSSDRRGASQTGYRILIASTIKDLSRNKADIWDSGKVLSSNQSHIRFKGKDLSSSSPYFWKVKIWDDMDKESNWSEPSFWITGILDKSEWKATWITFDALTARSQPLFRKEFSLKKDIKSAIAHVAGLGYYELYLNGSKVGEHVLDPAQTNYEDYALYSSYDVTKQIEKNNMIGAMLGDGWHNQDKVWQPAVLPYGPPILICQLHIEFVDGSKAIIHSDESWEWTNGPVTSSNVYAGEIYDARNELPNWNVYNASKAGWLAVLKAESHPPKLIAQTIPPIKKIEELVAERIDSLPDGKYIFDFGQNFAGWVKLKIKAAKGTNIRIRFSEVLDKNGNLDITSTGGYATNVEQAVTYICKGDGMEIWEPRFTYHGFRYAEVIGLESMPANDLLTGVVIHNSVREVGKFICSDQQINQLHKLATWTLRSNLHGVPTDCPTREKCGWLGDAHVMAPMSIYNYDMQTFWIKYLYDIRSSGRNEVKAAFANRNKKVPSRRGIKPAGIPFQIAPGRRTSQTASVDWGSAIVQLPWIVYLYYGNKDILEEFYPDMLRWVEYCTEYLVKGHIVYEGLGDWGPPDGVKECPIELTSTAFHYLNIKLLTEAARTLNRQEDCDQYTALMKHVKAAFIEKFYNKESQSFGGQTANSVALDFGLVPEGEADKVSMAISEDVNNNHGCFMNTGIFGLQRIFNALSMYGNDQVAYQILTKKGSNSFEQMWKEHGATTLWEILPVKNFYDGGPERHSRNHPMQGGYDAWFFEGILGIKPDRDSPGFKNVVFRPELTSQLAWASGTYNSIYGEIKSEWRNENHSFIWNIEIPPNTTGTIYIPQANPSQIMENGKHINDLPEIKTSNEQGELVINIPSGIYQFEMINPQAISASHSSKASPLPFPPQTLEKARR